ncbi:hypothetical protein LTS18_014765, partial [Coniosporium uncinatum]
AENDELTPGPPVLREAPVDRIEEGVPVEGTTLDEGTPVEKMMLDEGTPVDRITLDDGTPVDRNTLDDGTPVDRIELEGNWLVPFWKGAEDELALGMTLALEGPTIEELTLAMSLLADAVVKIILLDGTPVDNVAETGLLNWKPVEEGRDGMPLLETPVDKGTEATLLETPVERGTEEIPVDNGTEAELLEMACVVEASTEDETSTADEELSTRDELFKKDEGILTEDEEAGIAVDSEKVMSVDEAKETSDERTELGLPTLLEEEAASLELELSSLFEEDGNSVIIDEDELDVVPDAREELGSTEGLGSTEEEEDRLSLEDEEVVGTLVVKTVEVSVTT